MKKIISILSSLAILVSMIGTMNIAVNASTVGTPDIALKLSKDGSKVDDEVVLDVAYSGNNGKIYALQYEVAYDSEYFSLESADPADDSDFDAPNDNSGLIKYGQTWATFTKMPTSASADISKLTFKIVKDLPEEGIKFTPSNCQMKIEYRENNKDAEDQLLYLSPGSAGYDDNQHMTVTPVVVNAPAAQLSISAENNILGKDESTKLNVTSKFFDPAPTFEESNFSVAGNTSKDTKVVKDGADFKLHIGADETASKVTVTVKSGDVTASVDVAVKGIVLTAADANVVKGGKTELKVTQNNVSETFTEANFTVEGNSSADTKVTAESGKYYLNVAADETASKITVKFAASTYTASVEVGVADVVCNWTNSKFTVSAGNTATANLKVSGIPEGVKYTVKYVVTSGDEYASVSSSSSTSAKIKGIKAGSAIVTAYVYLGENTGKDYVAEADLLVTVTKKSSSGNNNSGSTSGGSIAGGTAGSGSTGVNISARPDLYNPQFADLNEASWAADAINSLAKKGILTGRTDTEFAPNASVTRAEFVKMVSTLYNLVTPTSKFATQSFKDVPKDAWFFNYVEVCAQLGIVNGEGDGYFNPNALISRQEMAAIMYRTATIMGTKLTATEAVKTFADSNEISDYAKAAVSALQTAGIISGTSDTTFEPALACTRAQAAVIINNMYTKYAK